MFEITREIRKESENIARLESLGSGKPIRDCRGEVAKVAKMFEYYGGWADKFYGEVIPVPTSHLNYTLTRAANRPEPSCRSRRGMHRSSPAAGRSRPPFRWATPCC